MCVEASFEIFGLSEVNGLITGAAPDSDTVNCCRVLSQRKLKSVVG
jgi:hypothetical protein